MILSCGEALIDMLPREALTGEAAFAPHAGGAVFNTAIALGRLGAPSGFLSGISTDFLGSILKDTLAASNVTTTHAVFSGRPTTLAFVQLVNGQASYAFYDEGTAGRMLSPADIPELPDTVAALFFGGISLVGEPCSSAYEALMMREKDRRVIMMDPNVRPGFITDEAAYRTRIARMLAASHIVKVSDEDLHWLEGKGDEAALAGKILARGPQFVVITRGAEGATGYTRHGEPVAVASRKVEVVDTVGAGDTFNAGILASLDAQGLLTRKSVGQLPAKAIAAALRLGAQAAAVTVSRAGANPPWANELG